MVIGPLQFEQPLWLLLIPTLGALVFIIARRSISGLGAITRGVSLMVRLLVICLVSMALSEPSWRDEARDVALTVVLDRSASMPDQASEAVTEFLGQALGNADPARSRLGVITAAAAPRIESVPSRGVRPEDAWNRIIDAGLGTGDRDSTDLASAVRTALAVTPGDAGGRVLLISDGNETAGALLTAAEIARAQGVPIDVMPIRYEIEREVVLERLVAPTEARMGQSTRLRFVVRSTHETDVEIALEADGRVYDLTPNEPGLTRVERLNPGVNVIEAPITLDNAQPYRFSATVRPLDPSADAIVENNRSMAVTFVHGRGRVLIYSNNFAEAEQLTRTLTEAEIGVQLSAPDLGPSTFDELQQYSAVVLMNVSAGDFAPQRVRDLARYVSETGGGLVMIGGPRSLGAGGWSGSEVAEVLPVLLDPPQRRNLPRGALALVIDSSGSMYSPVGNTGLNQMEIAKAGALAAARALSPQDLITVVSFSGTYRVDLPLQEVEGSPVDRAINRLDSGGGTNMWPALEHAARILGEAQAGQKHMIVLTDGQSSGGDFQRLIRGLQNNNISLSAISIGDFADDPVLNNLALAAGGTFYKVSGAANIAKLPQLFIKEAQIVRRALIWEGDPFAPVVTDRAAEPMRNMPSSLPAVSGYIITTDRGGLSQITARAPTEEADPIVAQWQFGLGRAMVFTSDATTRWSTAWTTWAGFRAFWDQHIRWVMRPTGSADVQTVLQPDGDRTRVILNALESDGDPMNFGRFMARVLRPDGTGEPVELIQTGPGRYEGRFDTPEAGAYLFAATYESASDAGSAEGGQPVRGSVLASTTRAFADEHRAERDNTPLLQQVAEMTGGRVLAGDVDGEPLFDRAGVSMPVALSPIHLLLLVIAVGVFVADVGVRRVRVDLRAISTAMRRLLARGAMQKEERIDALKVARDKARSRFAATPEGKQRAAQKFEATPEQVAGIGGSPSAGPLTTAGAGVAVQRSGASPEGGQGPATIRKAKQDKKDGEGEEAGMSRLLQAKQRARQSMAPEDPKNQSL
ncbi:MAG: VWA domain-containing protein [Phycisphaerales bacterium]